MPNYNEETGIPYGVIALHNLESWVFDEFFYNGENLSYKAWREDKKKELLAEIEAEEEAAREDGTDIDSLPERDVESELDELGDDYQGEEEEYYLESDGCQLLLGYLGGAPLVWVLKSPHITHARQCSPCVPGAGDLDNRDEHGIECYDVPPEWRRKENENE